jgi:sarcosine oxidase subunit delta
VVVIPCPHCGPRNVSEFAYKGEAKDRPDPLTATRAAWREYLYVHENPAGWTSETWFHRAGCQTFIRVERHTVSNVVRSATPSRPSATQETGQE